ncbi:4-hydroxyphenylpyruvate dioxygenase [Photobacterium halotolerans]|uniref:4-hydroxyphenylpyruvate dioxygenase n=1 Tax=Photobacterium halotolerans TaxID=265726 RepID=A0A7X4WDV3_9GAMM|nr:4-hydroxyphenylpyruvate dioxygenase [Photobacterium halotolerans]NAW66939.1 4-hydroxyphenylpyruvate dioxygenase [Photobacterium halotolerans]NAW85846.1 4-hydroxyphenylpyruvate dioxygenase [Photobacterium halotolerans]NAX45716.1 4-hydroxyphenylpyruvate dioxygenase [Photobacterium halotolerans]
MSEMMKNPMGTDGFEFVEYTAPTPEGIANLKNLFRLMGFAEVAKHKHKSVWLYRQGDINFIVNGEQHSQAAGFAGVHGASVNAMAFRVKDSTLALEHAVENGATACPAQAGPMELNIPAVYGIGESLIYLVDRYGEHDIYEIDFDYYPDYQERLADQDAGLHTLDHLTHNVKQGNMDLWAGFYERIANFREIRHFDIKGKVTGLLSRAMTAPCGKIRIPINESSDDKSQIAEYLDQYNGEGIQHIALSTDNIFETVSRLKKNGLAFMDTPDTYYEGVNKRIPGHQEDLAKLKDLKILIDGDETGILLQIFTDTVIGPVFFEIIQRKGNEGFGEGNFQALFESIELDQIRRGVIQVPDNA